MSIESFNRIHALVKSGIEFKSYATDGVKPSVDAELETAGCEGAVREMGERIQLLTKSDAEKAAMIVGMTKSTSAVVRAINKAVDHTAETNLVRKLVGKLWCSIKLANDDKLVIEPGVYLSSTVLDRITSALLDAGIPLSVLTDRKVCKAVTWGDDQLRSFTATRKAGRVIAVKRHPSADAYDKVTSFLMTQLAKGGEVTKAQETFTAGVLSGAISPDGKTKTRVQNIATEATAEAESEADTEAEAQVEA